MSRRGASVFVSFGRRYLATSAQGCIVAGARLASTAAATASATSCSKGTTSFAAMLAATAAAAAFSGPVWASSHHEKTFIMIKPDGVHRGLISDIIARFERKGYRLVGIKVMVPSSELAGHHYDEHKERSFFPKLVNFLSSGPVVAMVWEGKDVIKYGRTLIGATNPLASAPGTIRGDYGVDMGRNIIHGSDSLASAQREIALWFSPEELAQYELHSKAWVYE